MNIINTNGTELQKKNKTDKQILDNKIIIIILILILGILLCLWLLGLNIEKQKQLNQKITDLQQQIETFEKQKIIRVVPTKISEERKNIEAKPTTDLAIFTCDYWKDKNYENNEFNSPAGTLTVSGTIIKKIEDKVFTEGEKVTKIYLVISEPKEYPQKSFYEYYLKLVEKQNSINDKEDQKLLFNLGTLEESNLVSDSNISNNLKNKIISLVDRNEFIRLKLTISIPQGRTVTDIFSFACNISE